MEYLTSNKIPVGRAASRVVDWLTDNLSWFFDALATGMRSIIDAVLFLLTAPHPLVLVLAFSILAYVLRRSLAVALLTAAGFLFILNQGYFEETMETLTLVLSSCILCMGLGVPTGIVAAHHPRFYTALRPMLDLMHTAIFVLPAPIRLTHLGISSTPRQLIEAGEAFGATPRQLLWKVELPYAMPQIRAGLTQTIMLSLSMVVIAALVGADGLGVPVVRALNTVNTALGFEAGIVIVVVAILLDRLFRARGTGR
jgi:glycine betaine/proline transport system permease protein